jgi:cellobiose-specific phosphotransferase system component IIB
MEESTALLIQKLEKMLNFGGEASLIVAISKTKEMRYTTKMNLCL